MYFLSAGFNGRRWIDWLMKMTFNWITRKLQNIFNVLLVGSKVFWLQIEECINILNFNLEMKQLNIYVTENLAIKKDRSQFKLEYEA